MPRDRGARFPDPAPVPTTISTTERPRTTTRSRVSACRAGDRLQRLSRRLHRGDLQLDNPREAGTEFSRWNQLQVTYRDPDGLGLPGQKGSEYQAYVELVRVSKTTGTWEKITSFDSNVQCAGGPSLCQADNTTKNFTVTFSHTFDFDNYAYAVYGGSIALATFSLTPVIYQLRLQAAPIIVQPGITDRPGPVVEFGPANQ